MDDSAFGKRHSVPHTEPMQNHIAMLEKPIPTQVQEQPMKKPDGYMFNRLRTYDSDIKAFQSSIDDLKQELTDIIEDTPEFKEYSELHNKTIAAQEKVKIALERNSDYIRLKEELADERISLRDVKASLSDFLVGYIANTGERQIEVSETEARDIVVKASLSKKPKKLQLSLFRKSE